MTWFDGAVLGAGVGCLVTFAVTSMRLSGLEATISELSERLGRLRAALIIAGAHAHPSMTANEVRNEVGKIELGYRNAP